MKENRRKGKSVRGWKIYSFSKPFDIESPPNCLFMPVLTLRVKDLQENFGVK